MDWLTNDAPKVRTAYGSRSSSNSSRPRLTTILPSTINSSTISYGKTKKDTLSLSSGGLFGQENADLFARTNLSSVVMDTSETTNRARERIEFDDIILQRNTESKAQKRHASANRTTRKNKEGARNRGRRSRRRPLLKSIIADELNATSKRQQGKEGRGVGEAITSKLKMERIRNLGTTTSSLAADPNASTTAEAELQGKTRPGRGDSFSAVSGDETDSASVRSERSSASTKYDRRRRTSRRAKAILALGRTQAPSHATSRTTSPAQRSSENIGEVHTPGKARGNARSLLGTSETSTASDTSSSGESDDHDDDHDDVPFDLGCDTLPSVQSRRRSQSLLHSAAVGAEMQASRTLNHLSRAYRRLSVAPRQRASMLPVAYGKKQGNNRPHHKLSLAPSFHRQRYTEKGISGSLPLSPNLVSPILPSASKDFARTKTHVSSPPPLLGRRTPQVPGNVNIHPHSPLLDCVTASPGAIAGLTPPDKVRSPLTPKAYADTPTMDLMDIAVVTSPIATVTTPATAGMLDKNVFDQVWTECLESILEFLPSRELLLTLPQVSKRWEACCSSVYAWRVASNLHKIPSIRNIVGATNEDIEDGNIHVDPDTEAIAHDDSTPPFSRLDASNHSTTLISRARKPRRRTRNQQYRTNGLTCVNDASDARSDATLDTAPGANSSSSMRLSTPSHLEARPYEPLPAWTSFLRQFPWGEYLASGAYKAVYRVWNSTKREYEAMSIMDVAAIAETGNLNIVSAEVQVGCLLSKLTRDGTCPNFLEIRQTMLLNYSAAVHFPLHWNHREEEEEEEEDGAGHDSNRQRNATPGFLFPPSVTNPAVGATKEKCPYDRQLHSLTVAEKILQARAQISQQRMEKKKQWLYPTRNGRTKTNTMTNTNVNTSGVVSEHDSMAMCLERMEQAKLCIARAQATIPNHPPLLNYEGMDTPKGVYLYSRMELCLGGSVEDWLASVEDHVVDIENQVFECHGAEDWERQYNALMGMSNVNGAKSLKSENEQARVDPTVRHMRRLSLEERRTFPMTSSSEQQTLSRVPTKVAELWSADAWALKFARDTFFQMCFPLFVAQDRLHLRHFDLKLLNVFLQPARIYVGSVSTSPRNRSQETYDILHFRYARDQHMYNIQLHAPHLVEDSPHKTSDINEANDESVSLVSQLCKGFVAKLADFGTASTCPDAAHMSIEAHHFTTFENSAPEMLYNGKRAKQGYAIDHWAMGLSFFHLLTGSVPYEETMQSATCPEPLRELLGNVWSYKLRPSMWKRMLRNSGRLGRNNMRTYEIERNQAIEFIATDDDENADILADTLWRYLVLLGPPPSSVLSQPRMGICHLLHACTLMEEGSTRENGNTSDTSTQAHSVPIRPRRTRRNVQQDAQGGYRDLPLVLQQHPLVEFFTSKEWKLIQETYQAHRKEFALRSGMHPLLVRLRRRCAFAPEAMELLEGLLDWNAESRWTMEKALESEFFLALTRENTDASEFNWQGISERIDGYSTGESRSSLVAYLSILQPGDIVVKEFTCD